MSDDLKRLTAALADRYAIERELGHGGMAAVYLARDLRHGRMVAVKVLGAEVSGAVGAERFLREIQIEAQLSHPHILPLYDSGEADGFLYYVMPYVEGESLRERLAREGQLALEEALLIVREVADGLGYAHSHGVVHRDIKPDNIMLAGGHALIADFGIARALSEGGDARLTGTGVAIGTPTYMSPEQSDASAKVDGRSDLYSLGCVLYEMLVGEPPYGGPTAQAIMARHSLEAIPSVRVVRPTIPDEVEAAITRVLAKVPADRFTTAHQLIEALAGAEAALPSPHRTGPATRAARLPAGRRATLGWAAAVLGLALGFVAFLRFSDASGPPRIVVLPFRGAGSDEYFVDGITEEITSRLSTLEGIGVIARTSAMQYKQSPKSVRAIGEELDVSYVVEGSVRRDRAAAESQLVRVSARLIKVASGTAVWDQQYDVQLAGIFQVQSDIAQKVASALSVALLEPDRRRLAERPTDDLDAYDLYLRGNDYYNRSWSPADVDSAVAMYREAVSRDPRFALARAQLARTHAWIHRLNIDPTEERLEAARAQADTALALAPDLAEAHIAMALYHYWGRWDYGRAVEELMTARRLQPGNAAVYHQLGNVRRRLGAWKEAVANYRQAAELDPRSHVVWSNLGECYVHMREYDQAVRHLDRALALAPTFLDALLLKANVAVLDRGDVTAAREVLAVTMQRVPPAQWRLLPGLWLFGFFRIVPPPDSADGIVPGNLGLDRAGYHLAAADAAMLAGGLAAGRAHFDSARVELEAERAHAPDDAWILGQLGVAYAGLGRAAEALEAGRRAVQVLPVSRDALDGPYWVVNLARILVMLGQPEEALDQIELALAIPARISAAWLRLDPVWSPLRRHARFRSLLAERTGGGPVADAP